MLDDTAGGNPDICDPAAVEFICRGFAYGVYLEDEETGTGGSDSGGSDSGGSDSGTSGPQEVIDVPGFGVSHICLDHVDAAAQGLDPDSDYTDIRMCWPFFPGSDFFADEATSLPDLMLAASLREKCEMECVANITFPETYPGHTLQRVECVITVLPTVVEPPWNYNPDCVHSVSQSVDWSTPLAEEIALGNLIDGEDDFKPCSLVSCQTSECSWFDTTNPVGYTNSNPGTSTESAAIIDQAYLGKIEGEIAALWECDPGRYAEAVLDPGDPENGIERTTIWYFKDLAPGSLMYELGLRSKDTAAELWAFNPATKQPITPVYSLDSVAGIAAAYSVLFTASDIAIRVQRPSRGGSTHTVYISVEDCGVDTNGDGIPDVVRCANP